MAFEIVPQTIKVKGEEIKVLAKHIKCFPQKNKKTGEITFGRIHFPLVKMVLKERNELWKLTLSETRKNWRQLAKSGQEIGTFILHEPKKLVPEYERNAGTNSICKDRRGNPIVDYLKPPKEIDGEKRRFDKIDVLWDYLVENNGLQTATIILENMVNCFAETVDKLIDK